MKTMQNTLPTARSAPPPPGPGQLDLRLSQIERLTTGVAHFVFEAPDGGPLPSFSPGSHIGVRCGETWNSYSLTNEGILPESYEISVLRQAATAGGSVWLHEREPGEIIRITAPRSGFPVPASAAKQLLIAGGIGVTAILSHARDAVRWSRPFEVHYVHRPGLGAHARELQRLAGLRVHLYTGREELWQRLDTALRDQPVGTHLSVCGPQAMIDEVESQARMSGWPAARVHSEAFASAPADPGVPFEVLLSRSGRSVPVASGVSMLEALLSASVDVPHLCKQGVCGECRLAVLSGERLEHRDSYLSDDEKETGEAIMPCVSRTAAGRLEVDL